MANVLAFVAIRMYVKPDLSCRLNGLFGSTDMFVLLLIWQTIRDYGDARYNGKNEMRDSVYESYYSLNLKRKLGPPNIIRARQIKTDFLEWT